jgi:hypothetical protein
MEHVLVLQQFLLKLFKEKLSLFLPKVFFLTLVKRKPLYFFIFELLNDPIFNSRVFSIRF